MNSNINRAYILIDKYYTGQASEEEIDLLKQWKDSSSENIVVYNELIQLLDVISNIKDWKQFDNSKAWTRFQSKLKFQEFRFSWKKAVAVAAIFVLVSMATFTKFGAGTEGSGTYLSGNDQRFSLLTDGSEIFLDPNSRIDVSAFNANNRILQSHGDFFVNVEHDAQKPFSIKTDNVTISVLGTSFRVEENNEITTVRVRDGKVRITVLDGSKYTIEANQVFVSDGKDVSINSIANYDWGLYAKEFDDESVFNLLNELSDEFGNIKFSASEISPECRITTKISQSTVVEILQELSLIFDIDYTIKDGVIVVSKISC